MWGSISPGECSALYRLVAESPTDALIKTDVSGRIVHAASAAAGPCLTFAVDPVGRHLLELVHPSFCEIVLGEHSAAVAGKSRRGWVEILAIRHGGGHHWLKMKLGALPQNDGAIGIFRSSEDRPLSGDTPQLASATTDPLTQLANREAFVRLMTQRVESGALGCVALLDVDHFRAINLQHGHSGGDRVLVAVARLLRGLLRKNDVVGHIGGGTFGVLLPDVDEAAAHATCARVLAAVRELDDGIGKSRLTASAGVARLAVSADMTLREAELTLLAAKARGRNRVERARARSASH